MENIHLGKNTALRGREIKPIIYERMDFSKIPFDLEKLENIDGNGGWYPTESDKPYMTEKDFQEALDNYKAHKANLFFENTTVAYDSFDGEFASGASYPYEIIVTDGEKKHVISIDGDDCLIFNYNNTTEITINGLERFTYADFIRFCQLCGINLKSKYIL